MSKATKPRKSMSLKQEKDILNDARAGILSIKQIADKHGFDYFKVYRLCKKIGVGTDLHVEVVQKAQHSASLMIADNLSDGVVVNENAQILLAMMREHSQSVMRARSVAMLLMDDLEEAITRRPEIEETIEMECAKDASPRRRERLYRAVSLPANTRVLADLSGALKTLIGLEREMFNIGQGGDGEGDKTLEDYVLSLPAVN